MRFVYNGIIIGPLYLHYYGMLILAGVLAGIWLAARAGKKLGFSQDQYWDMLPWMLFLGIAGARLWHVLMPSISSGITFDWYLRHPLEIFAVWNGGLGIPGGILGGALGVWIYCRRNKLPYPSFMDTIGVGLPLGQAIGRWGNFVNQELYGLPSDLPWAITIDLLNRIPTYADVARYHPLFLYESIYNLLICFVLWKVFQKGTLRPGSVFLLYGILYPVGRFFLEFLRLDAAYIGQINVNQMIMAVSAVVSFIGLLYTNRKITE